MASTSRNDGSLMTEINVTPLVDVVLVLLVIMMVTATAVAHRTIALDLPKSRGGQADGANRPMVVAVDARGSLFLGTEPADDAAVRARARELARADPELSVVLAADGQARHEWVVRIIELLRSERISKIAIVVRNEATP